MKTNSVLIIEPDDQLRSVLSLALEQEGLDLHFSNSNDEALRFLETLNSDQPIDVILYSPTNNYNRQSGNLIEFCSAKFGVEPYVYSHHKTQCDLVNLSDIKKAVSHLVA